VTQNYSATNSSTNVTQRPRVAMQLEIKQRSASRLNAWISVPGFNNMYSTRAHQFATRNRQNAALFNKVGPPQLGRFLHVAKKPQVYDDGQLSSTATRPLMSAICSRRKTADWLAVARWRPDSVHRWNASPGTACGWLWCINTICICRISIAHRFHCCNKSHNSQIYRLQ